MPIYYEARLARIDLKPEIRVLATLPHCDHVAADPFFWDGCNDSSSRRLHGASRTRAR